MGGKKKTTSTTDGDGMKNVFLKMALSARRLPDEKLTCGMIHFKSGMGGSLHSFVVLILKNRSQTEKKETLLRVLIKNKTQRSQWTNISLDMLLKSETFIGYQH
ncbi:hypothetical protein AMECASPLE_000298 [Ameca splendens]|uniref:Uncharacterized protein n=1 Tax=Ameca splendens TaxID=208324 RepID=A0ABV0Y8J4_9TELE